LSVSLLASHHPSDQLQVMDQRSTNTWLLEYLFYFEFKTETITDLFFLF